MKKYYDLGVYCNVGESPDVRFISDANKVPVEWEPIDALPECDKLYAHSHTVDYHGRGDVYAYANRVEYEPAAYGKSINAECLEQIINDKNMIACRAVFCQIFYALEMDVYKGTVLGSRSHYYAVVEELAHNPGYLF